MTGQENQEENLPNTPTERPLECGECKKSVGVLYTEITGLNVIRTCMCNDCPELQRRLFDVPLHHIYHPKSDNIACLACGNCGTTLEAVRVGTPLGCSACYEVFKDLLISEMAAAKKIPLRIVSHKKSLPIHIGRSPGESMELNPTLRLLALNEALNETIKTEDYEQSAWLRDQIKALTENPREEK